MEYLLAIFKMTAAIFLIGIAIYSSVYLSQINRVEEQFGLRLPLIIKKLLGVLAMIPMVLSIAVLGIVLIELLAP